MSEEIKTYTCDICHKEKSEGEMKKNVVGKITQYCSFCYGIINTRDR